jgi:hypothetical protein
MRNATTETVPAGAALGGSVEDGIWRGEPVQEVNCTFDLQALHYSILSNGVPAFPWCFLLSLQLGEVISWFLGSALALILMNTFKAVGCFFSFLAMLFL